MSDKNELLKLNKDQLSDRILELEGTDAGAAYAAQEKAEGALATEVAAHEETKRELATANTRLENALGIEEKEELDRQISDLTARNKALEATKGDPRPIVEVNGKMKLVTAKNIRLNDGRKVSAQELMKMPEELKALDKSGSSILKDV